MSICAEAVVLGVVILYISVVSALGAMLGLSTTNPVLIHDHVHVGVAARP
jgi:hypothetical protein